MTGSIQEKVALVTGGTGAIGKAIASKLAEKSLDVVIIARNEPKAQKTVQEIRQDTGNPNVSYQITDLSRLQEIQTLASEWKRPLNILVNNAAVTPQTRQETPEGIELQFATNVLAYFRMTLLFRDHFKACAPARIVDVASYWAGGLDLSDLEFKRRHYSNGAAYRQSKQANRMLVAAWTDRLKKDGITINACHPGDVNSTLSNNLGFGGSQSPDQGAETPVWLALSPAGGEFSGKYFEHKLEKPDPFTRNKEQVEALFDLCEKFP